MNDLEYPRERTLGSLTLALGAIAWLIIIVGTLGIALALLLAGFIGYLFAQSALVAWIKGNGVALGERQFPDLHAQFVACCDRLQISQRPQAYVLNGNGRINAFAARFLGHQYVVLLSGTVEAMRDHPDGVAFYIGHELGHIRMGHMTKHFVCWPVLWLPLLGAAYSRAKESTCDRHGLACSSSPENAARALAALAAGGRRWGDLDIAAFRDQASASTGFWMSLHELCSGYPWLTKRVIRVTTGDDAVPARHPFAWVLAAFIPFASQVGAGFGLLLVVYIAAVIASAGIPFYLAHATSAQLSKSIELSAPARTALAQYYAGKHAAPATLGEAGVVPRLTDGSMLTLNPKDMSLMVETAKGTLVFTPRLDDKGNVGQWDCAHDTQLSVDEVPAMCAAEVDDTPAADGDAEPAAPAGKN